MMKEFTEISSAMTWLTGSMIIHEYLPFSRVKETTRRPGDGLAQWHPLKEPLEWKLRMLVVGLHRCNEE